MGGPDFILENGTGHELVQSISVTNLLAQRDAMLQRIAAGLALLHEAREICKAAGFGSVSTCFRGFEWILGGPHRYFNDTALLRDDPMPEIRKRADAVAWDLLMHASGLISLMDTKAREQWSEAIEKCETLELTKENIAATFAGIHEQRVEIFERGVIECFRNLNWDYKTNQPFKLGKRIILTLRHHGFFSRNCVDRLVDLQRVFCILDGKPEEDHRDGLYQRLVKYHGEDRGEHDDTYMHIRWFKNGNGHVTFKRPDLIERMNRIIAKHYPGALPAPREDD